MIARSTLFTCDMVADCDANGYSPREVSDWSSPASDATDMVDQPHGREVVELRRRHPPSVDGASLFLDDHRLAPGLHLIDDLDHMELGTGEERQDVDHLADVGGEAGFLVELARERLTGLLTEV